MPPANNPNTELYWLIGIIAGLILLILFVNFARFINEFSRKLRYYNIEIGRTKGSEQRYWEHRRRRLWLSLIPFVKYR